ncbi:MAG: N,N-dimethylformamidase beta subunit family domain-containing protein, partial [Acidimicrobiales bacterium]
MIQLAVSSDRQTCNIEVVRVGRDEEIVAAFTDVPVSNQPVPEDAAVAGCGWQTTLEIDIDSTWSTGFYLIRLTSPDSETGEAFFVVRPSEPGRAL